MTVKVGETRLDTDFLRKAKMKQEGVPLWTAESYGTPETTKYLRTLFGKDRRIISRYYAELADIPGTLNTDIDVEEAEYTNKLWNAANCVFPLIVDKKERYDPMTGDDLAEQKQKEHDMGQRYNTSVDGDGAALLPKKRSLEDLPKPQKQEAKADLNHPLRYARITMGFIIIFDITKRDSWDKAKELIANIKKNIFRGKTARCPIVVFGNKLDTLKRGESGHIKRAFIDIKNKIGTDCKDWSAFEFPPVNYFVGSVKQDYAISLDLSKKPESGGVPNPAEIMKLPRFTLAEVVTACVSMRFNANWVSKEESTASKAGLVYQVYRHCEDIMGLAGDDDEGGKVDAATKSQRGCCASLSRGCKSICSIVVCFPCKIGLRLANLCGEKSGDDNV